MNEKIIYATMTGHSRKLAEAIGKAHGLSVHNINEAPTLVDCDLLFLVSGIYGGECKAELLAFIKTLKATSIKQVVLITTSTRGVAQGGLRKALEAEGITVAEQEHQGIGGFLFAKMFRPNQEDIAAAVAFAGDMLKASKGNVI